MCGEVFWVFLFKFLSFLCYLVRYSKIQYFYLDFKKET